MNPHHHPSEAVLTDYVAGALRPAFAIVTAAHVESCSDCRERVRLLERVGGDLLAELPEAEMSPEVLDHALARLERDKPAAAAAVQLRPVAERLQFGRKRYVAPGMWVRHARRDVAGDDILYLLRLPRGVGTVSHGHAGCEFTTVLKGSYQDDSGHFTAGDFAEMDASIEHRPAVTQDGECICIIASEHPMKMQGWMGKLVQTLTGT